MAAVLELLPATLDAQLHADDGLTQFEYMVLAMLSEAPERRLRMSDLAAHTTATLPRLSRVVAGLEDSGFVVRSQCMEDRRATNADLTDAGLEKLVAAAPGHVETVRRHVIDPLAPGELSALGVALGKILATLDPDGKMLAGARLAAGGAGTGTRQTFATGSVHPLPRLATPAARALREAGYQSLDALAGERTSALMKLHGVGRGALRMIRDALDAAGLEPLDE